MISKAPNTNPPPPLSTLSPPTPHPTLLRTELLRYFFIVFSMPTNEGRLPAELLPYFLKFPSIPIGTWRVDPRYPLCEIRISEVCMCDRIYMPAGQGSLPLPPFLEDPVSLEVLVRRKDIPPPLLPIRIQGLPQVNLRDRDVPKARYMSFAAPGLHDRRRQSSLVISVLSCRGAPRGLHPSHSPPTECVGKQPGLKNASETVGC